MKKDKLVIGITGAFGSGKSTATEFLVEKGFKKVILSSFLEEELRKRGEAQITRKLLQDMGNLLREKFGADILAKKAIGYASRLQEDKIVVDGIRNIAEIETLRSYGNYVQLGILADRRIRFERLKKLKRREDLTWNLFQELDSRDLGIGENKQGLQVAFCITLSDVFITNNKTVEDFRKNLTGFLEEIK